MISTLLFASLVAPPEVQQVEPPAPPETHEEAWTTSLATYAFDPPDDDAYVSVILRADRGPLHLEARYNYEDRDTGSVWAGRTWSWGDAVTLDATPMAGVVFGDTDGVAPGLELDVAWKALSWYTESEYLFDLDDSDESFFYTWSELTLMPVDWLRFGLVAQRTRVYDQELDVDRGFLLGVSFSALSVEAYLFNPDQDEPYGGVSVGVGF